MFNRGRTNPGLFPQAAHIAGNRDPAEPPGLSNLAGGPWDAVVDVNGYDPADVAALADVLPEPGRYVHVSTGAVYEIPFPTGGDGTAPVRARLAVAPPVPLVVAGTAPDRRRRYCRAMHPPPAYLSEDVVQARVAELAVQINADYDGAGELVLIGVLKGSFIFLADLARRLTVPHRVEFLAVSAYGDRDSEVPGSVRLLMDVRHDIGGEHVLLVEDIVDTGRTMGYLRRLLEARRPASLRTCTLLHKPDRTEEDVQLDYLGFTIPDVWVVGYGLDYAEQHRTLPYIAQLPPELR